MSRRLWHATTRREAPGSTGSRGAAPTGRLCVTGEARLGGGRACAMQEDGRLGFPAAQLTRKPYHVAQRRRMTVARARLSRSSVPETPARTNRELVQVGRRDEPSGAAFAGGAAPEDRPAKEGEAQKQAHVLELAGKGLLQREKHGSEDIGEDVARARADLVEDAAGAVQDVDVVPRVPHAHESGPGLRQAGHSV